MTSSALEMTTTLEAVVKFEVDGATGVTIAGTRLPALAQLFL
jgi:hypothetical protein